MNVYDASQPSTGMQGNSQAEVLGMQLFHFRSSSPANGGLHYWKGGIFFFALTTRSCSSLSSFQPYCICLVFTLTGAQHAPSRHAYRPLWAHICMEWPCTCLCCGCQMGAWVQGYDSCNVGHFLSGSH